MKAHLEARLKQRLEAESTFRTGIRVDEDELFLAVPRELSTLCEHVLRHERRVRAGLEALPPIARGALVRGLVISEVVSTNEIEGVYSTRRQISDLLERSEGKSTSEKDRRFQELANLYLGLSEPGVTFPTTPRQVRALYDLLMDGEDLGSDTPDGTLFRRGEVEIIGSGSRIIHEGVYPESHIIDMVERMIALVGSDEIPSIYAAIIGHYIFEYAHPFYDGNGRTGRYLLALALSTPLSTLTSLSLSRVIAENKGAYYRSFREAEHPLNHGELTLFVINMLESIALAQDELDEELTRKRAQLDRATDTLDDITSRFGLGTAETNIIFILVQHDLFGAFADVSQAAIAEHIGLGAQQTRRHTKRLEDLGLICAVSQRPLRFVLSLETRESFGLAQH